MTAYIDTCGTNKLCKEVALGVGTLFAQGPIQVYPNPANDKLFVDGAEGASASLVNSIGMRVSHLTLTSNRAHIDLSGLPAGVYLLYLQDKDGTQIAGKIVRQ